MNRFVVCVRPSVIAVEENNVLINPKHADAGKLEAWKVREWVFDGGLMR